jgi:hypothetical protein
MSRWQSADEKTAVEEKTKSRSEELISPAISIGRYPVDVGNDKLRNKGGYQDRGGLYEESGHNSFTTIIRFQDIKDSESNYNHYDVE